MPLPQPTVLTQRQGLSQQITVQPVPSQVSAPTQLTPHIPPGVTILRPQQLPAPGQAGHSGQATQVLSTSAAAVVSTIRQPLPASTLTPQVPRVSISPSSPSLSMVQLPTQLQLPTQPIPPSEIRTTKQVLLEPKNVPPKISIPSTSPRTATITLPTHPVPRSTAMGIPPSSGGVAPVSSVVNVGTGRPLVSMASRCQVPTTASMIQTMLPNQPLPMTPAQQMASARPGAIVVTTSTMANSVPHMFSNNSIVSSPLHSPNNLGVTVTPTGPPRLPQHPLPPTSSCKIEPVEQPRTVVALKKRDILMAKDPSFHNSIDLKSKGELLVEAAMAKNPLQSQPEYLKPRDAYGGGAHLRLAKQESINSDVLIKDEMKPGTPVSILSGQPTANYPQSAEHLQALRVQQDLISQEINLYYQQYLKQGQPEHMAIQLAQQMVENKWSNLKPADLVAGSARPGSVPPPMDNYHPPSIPTIQPPMAHGAPGVTVTAGPPGSQVPDTYLRQADSPMQGTPSAAHAHSRIPYSMGHPGPAGTPDHILQSYRPGAAPSSGSEDLYHHALEPSPASPTSGPPIPSPVEFVLPNFESYPVVWQGHLGLKQDIATVQFHYVSGCKDLARASLPATSVHDPRMQLPTLKIGQRMRLEESQLSGVQRKMLQPEEHCILLALPCGKDTLDVESQSRKLRSNFITYLQLKSAAGIVNVEGSDTGAAYVVHVFPSCDFANETMSGIAPDLLARVAEIEHMVIIIATVFDNK